MASFAHNNINPGLFGKIFRLECPVDRVSFFREFDMWRDIYRVDLNRMFNNQKMKLECPKMAITPGANSFNVASHTYSNDVWDNWVDEASTSYSSGSTIYSDTTSQTVASLTITWTTWVRDQYVYYHDVETRDAQNRVHAVWSVWTEEATRELYESVADEVTDGLREATERMGRAFEHASVSTEEAAEAMRNLGRQNREANERRQSEFDKLQAEKAEAEAKAKDLLLDIIGENELAVYEETGRVFVKGKKNDYIVQREGFVQQIQKGKIQDLCAHINKNKYPLTDNVVAMKLLIESDEDQFLEIANRHGNRKYDELPKAACM